MENISNNVAQLSYALNTLYILFSAVLVMWMAAGFAMLEAGLVRSKNVIEILAKNLGLFSISCLMFYLVGYSVMYHSGSSSSIFPYLGFLIPSEHSVSAVTSTNSEIGYSMLADFMFQVVFVATAVSIVSGTVAERMKLSAFFIFTAIYAGFIYPVTGFWKWGGGFLDSLGFVDFAGSGLVHLAGASAAVAAVILVGAREGKYTKDGRVRALVGSNMPLVVLGTFILWMGWFGFNGGSYLSMNDVASANGVALVFVNTALAGCAGALGALALSKIWFGKVDLTMGLNGTLGGLVAITADPSSAMPLEAILIGTIAGIIVVSAVVFIDTKLKLDDPVGAIGVHGACGVFGLLAVAYTNADASLLNQAIGIICIFGFTFSLVFVLFFIIKKTIGIRVSKEDEIDGLDLSECGMEAYPEFKHK